MSLYRTARSFIGRNFVQLAHVIEQAFLFVVEAAGFGWVKIDTSEAQIGTSLFFPNPY